MSGGRITYDDAIASLRSMFPTVNPSTLAKVLQTNRESADVSGAESRSCGHTHRATGGAMEPAIEQLLAMEVPDTTPNPPAEPTRRPDQVGQTG